MTHGFQAVAVCLVLFASAFAAKSGPVTDTGIIEATP